MVDLYKYEKDEEKSQKELNPVIEKDIEDILNNKINFRPSRSLLRCITQRFCFRRIN